MRILVDARTLCRPRSGIGHYLDNLLKALSRIDVSNHYTLCGLPGRGYQLPDLPAANFRMRSLRLHNSLSIRLYRDSNFAYRVMRSLSRRYDLVHEPAYEPLPFAPRSVLTIHDMIWFKCADDFPEAVRMRYQRRLRESARNASLIITPSEAARQDLLEILGTPAEKVYAISLGVDPDEFQCGLTEFEALQELAALGIRGPFLLTIGDLYRRKNNITAVRAFALLPEELRKSFQLVIAGAETDAKVMREIGAEIAGSGLEESVLVTGYVTDRQRLALLSLADALLYPSLYEGFGLPPLEAMACGVPVIASSNSSLPEVIGSAGLLVTAFTEPEAWAENIARTLTDPALRRQLAEEGRARARLFTWERTARETLRVYELAAACG